MTKKKRIVFQLISVGVLSAILALLLILKTNQAICEFVATTFARAWIWLTGNLFGWIPISFYEIFLIVVIIWLVVAVVFLIKNICKKSWDKFFSLFLTVVISVLCFVNFYTILASFSYNRQPLPKEVLTEYGSEDLTFEQALEMANYVIDKANQTYEQTEHDKQGNIVLPSFSALNDLIIAEYDRLDGYKYFSSFTPRAKRIANKWIMSQMHIVGVFFAPFGEANINGNENNLFTPSTMAHEIAHAKGVMRESDANSVSLYLCLTSDNAYLQYSGWATCLSKAISLVSYYPEWTQDLREDLRNSVNPKIWAEIGNYNKFYAQFSLFEDMGNFFNDIYLKLQGQTNGTGSYNDPAIFEGTGEFTEDGKEIFVVRKFNDVQNVLITLYKQGRFEQSL